MAVASIACVHRNWRSSHCGRCCGCGAEGGGAAGAEEAARAVIAGRRGPAPTKVQRGRRRPTPHFCQTTNAARAGCTRMPAVLFVRKTSAAYFYALHACRAIVLSRRVTRSLFQPLPDASSVDPASVTHSTLPPESALRRHLYLMHSLRTRSPDSVTHIGTLLKY